MSVDRYALPGIPLSIFDKGRVTDVPLGWTLVTHKIYKKGPYAYVGLRDSLLAGEVIEMGLSKTKYKVIKLEKLTVKGRIFKIQRIDCHAIDQFNIEDVEVGTRANIVNRQSYEQQLCLIFDK